MAGGKSFSTSGLVPRHLAHRRTMKLVSVNTGLPREVKWHPPSSELRRAGGRIVTTAIYKEPVAGRVALRRLNLDGDRQAGRRGHGGGRKALHSSSLPPFRYWKAHLP